jgi:hypothetical protein
MRPAKPRPSGIRTPWWTSSSADLGTTTSAVTFLRQIGASAGVAAIGALITVRFADRLPPGAADRLPGGAGALSADSLAALPPDLRGTVAAAFGQAAPPVFGYVAPLLGVAFLLTLALPARPLRETAHVDAPAAEAAASPGIPRS